MSHSEQRNGLFCAIIIFTHGTNAVNSCPIDRNEVAAMRRRWFIDKMDGLPNLYAYNAETARFESFIANEEIECTAPITESDEKVVVFKRPDSGSVAG